MKRPLGIIATCSAICFLNLAMLLVLGVMGGVHVSVAGPQNDGCGDVDGSGSVQLADAVYLLNYLFVNGPDLACAQPMDPQCPCWPPRPEDIVNLTGLAEGQSPGDQVILFNVPAEQWLVLVDIRVTLASMSLLEIDAQGGVEVQIATQILIEDSKYKSSLGVAFQPGSSVALEFNAAVSTVYHITGYLVDAP